MVNFHRMTLRLVLTELFGGFLALPAWWYSQGLSIVGQWVKRTVRNANDIFALGVWVRNLFVPMYGETEWSGRLISFGVRAAMILVRGAAVAFWSVLAVAAYAAYAVALPLALLGIAYHGLGLLFF